MLPALIGFLAGFALALLPYAVRARRWGAPVHVWAEDDPAALAGYLAEVARHLDEKPERLRMRLHAPAGMTLDLNAAGALVLSCPGRPAAVCDLRRRWIADHPVPLALPAVVYVQPVGANRFRVRSAPPSALPRAAGAFLCVCAVTGLVCACLWAVTFPLGALAAVCVAGRGPAPHPPCGIRR